MSATLCILLLLSHGKPVGANISTYIGVKFTCDGVESIGLTEARNGAISPLRLFILTLVGIPIKVYKQNAVAPDLQFLYP